MSKKRRFAKVVFWCLLAFGTIAGSPIDPQDIEDTLRIMNETKIEVVLEKGDPPPDLPPLLIDAGSEIGGTPSPWHTQPAP
ncbi:MAG TPA: hypothetical protein VJN69_15490 [Candidatus Acidoferrales bacterium]|nr:hypothetical protein [Candidatus Acidoferrales bacterium]